MNQELEHLKTKQLRQEWSRLGCNTIAAIKLHFELLLALMISFFLSKVYHSFPDPKSVSARQAHSTLLALRTTRS